jgi:hypothetical protein
MYAGKAVHPTELMAVHHVSLAEPESQVEQVVAKILPKEQMKYLPLIQELIETEKVLNDESAAAGAGGAGTGAAAAGAS